MRSIGNVPIGEVVMLEWNREHVQVVYQSFCRTTIRSLTEQGGERDICTACEVLPYEGKSLGNFCACGCGRIVSGKRLTRKYATRGCKDRVFRRTKGRDRNSGHARAPRVDKKPDLTLPIGLLTPLNKLPV
jgi:hypothetical protein